MTQVLYISKYFTLPSDEDTGSRGFHLCHHLSREFDVTVFASYSRYIYDGTVQKNTYEVKQFDTLKVVLIKTLGFEKSGSIKRILSWFEFELKLLFYVLRFKIRPDMTIISSLSILSVLSGSLIKTLRKSKFIFEIRDIWPLTLIEEYAYPPSNIFVRFLRAVERHGYKRADLVVGTMPKLEDHVRGSVDRLVPVACIPQGYAQEQLIRFNESVEQGHRADDLESYFNKDKFSICYAGTFGITNVLDYIFDLAERMQDEDAIEFVFFGDGALKEELVARYGHLKNVVIGPRLPKQIVPIALAKAQLLIVATSPHHRWHYGQSLNKLVDYMLSGTPIYAIYGGYDDMLNDGRGFISTTHDLDRVVHDINKISAMKRDDLSAMGLKAQSWLLKHRSYEKIAQKYASFIKATLTRD